MISKLRFACSVAVLISLVLFISGCNTAGLRIPGASLSFPETPTGYKAKSTTFPSLLVVTTPIDQRSQHYGELVAGTKWKSVSNDPFWFTDVSQIIEQMLIKELRASGLFPEVTKAQTSPYDVIMKTEIHAFCSQFRGFVYGRVAGITSLHVILEQNGKILMDRKFERVVTDADKEYTGSQVATIEQAMKVTMADSLRELLKNIKAN